jgi:2,4-dienoyl-CoA reductase-like NADH-dependent reductase (Old Yellow Enzyme family)/thioredoxin reductase
MTEPLALPHLLSPIKLGPTEVRNRIVSTAHQTTLIRDSLPTEDFAAYHEARAKGGAGLIILEAAAVHDSGLLTSASLAAYLSNFADVTRATVDAVHAHGCALFVQLLHPGREQIKSPPHTLALAPSAIPSERYHVEPRAADGHEIEEIIEGFAQATHNARQAGFDGVEISAAHNYLIAQFLDPRLNRRNDQWGDGRRLLDAILDGVRRAGAGLTVGLRVSADAAIAPTIVELAAASVDYVSAALGDASTVRGAAGIVPPPPVEHGQVVDGLKQLPRPGRLLVTSRFDDPIIADELVASGRADLVGMTRALIADPELPQKAASGRLGQLVRCLGCNVCIAHYHDGLPIACSHNPRVGRERTFPRARPKARSATIAIVGAGPAGLAAAREAASCRHQVLLFEKEQAIGGQVRLYRDAPGQAHIYQAFHTTWRDTLASKWVTLELGTAPTTERLAAAQPDLVLVATGAQPYLPSVSLGNHVHQAWDVLAGERPPGRVVIADWGGDPSGLDCAEVLAASGAQVTLAVGALAAGEALHQYRRALYLERLYDAGVEIRHHLRLAGATTDRVRFTNLFAGHLSTEIEADALVLAQGRCSAPNLFERLRNQGLPVRRVGDAQTPRTLEEAILEATTAIHDLDAPVRSRTMSSRARRQPSPQRAVPSSTGEPYESP